MYARTARLEWILDDNVSFTNYHIPEFKVINIDVTSKQEGRLPSFTDKIDTIAIKLENDDDEETIEIQEQSEEDALYELMRETANIDPDFIFTQDGDEWIFPYLTVRAEKNKQNALVMNREPVLYFIISKRSRGNNLLFLWAGPL